MTTREKIEGPLVRGLFEGLKLFEIGRNFIVSFLGPATPVNFEDGTKRTKPP